MPFVLLQDSSPPRKPFPSGTRLTVTSSGRPFLISPSPIRAAPFLKSGKPLLLLIAMAAMALVLNKRQWGPLSTWLIPLPCGQRAPQGQGSEYVASPGPGTAIFHNSVHIQRRKPHHFIVLAMLCHQIGINSVPQIWSVGHRHKSKLLHRLIQPRKCQASHTSQKQSLSFLCIYRLKHASNKHQLLIKFLWVWTNLRGSPPCQYSFKKTHKNRQIRKAYSLYKRQA